MIEDRTIEQVRNAYLNALNQNKGKAQQANKNLVVNTNPHISVVDGVLTVSWTFEQVERDAAPQSGVTTYKTEQS